MLVTSELSTLGIQWLVINCEDKDEKDVDGMFAQNVLRDRENFMATRFTLWERLQTKSQIIYT